MKFDTIAFLKTPYVRNIFNKNNVAHIYLTGSFASWEETPESDIDIIYEKKSWVKFTLFNIGDIKYSLEEKLKREVDLISLNSIRTEIRNNILSNKKIIF